MGERILLIGNSGAGHSTAARRMQAALHLPLHHLDRLFWLPGWKPVSRNAFDQRRSEILKTPAWIIDGNYSRTLGPRLSAADTVLWLDFATPACLAGVFSRWVRQWGRQRPDMDDGCPEKIDWEFVRYVATWRRRNAAATESLLKNAASRGVRALRFTRRAALARFLDRLDGGRADETIKAGSQATRAGKADDMS